MVVNNEVLFLVEKVISACMDEVHLCKEKHLYKLHVWNILSFCLLHT